MHCIPVGMYACVGGHHTRAAPCSTTHHVPVHHTNVLPTHHTVEFLLTDKTDKIPTSMQSLEASISKLQSLVDKTYEYVEAVAVCVACSIGDGCAA